MGNNPSHFKGDALPVEQVSWDDAQEFIRKLNARDPGKNYRLPTEAGAADCLRCR
jgi:formylglycine-generating enzyme required for sulfatase activity